MKTYEITLVSKGSITQLPDSQKIFGALMYLHNEKCKQSSSDKTTKLVHKILNKEVNIWISNIFPKDYFPTPFEEVLSRIGEPTDKILYNQIKSRKYVKKELLNKLFRDPKVSNIANVYPFIQIEESSQVKMSIDSQKYNISGLDNKMFSIPQIFIYEVYKKEKRIVTEFNFYIGIDESKECEELLNIIEESIDNKDIIIRGKGSSHGYNTFQMQAIDLSNINYQDRTIFLNMGMLLPNQINYDQSTLKLFTSERRPYEMAGGWDKNFSSQFISFVKEGSIIVKKDTFEDIGQSIESPFDKKRAIVFGNSWLYPLNVIEGGNNFGKIYEI